MARVMINTNQLNRFTEEELCAAFEALQNAIKELAVEWTTLEQRKELIRLELQRRDDDRS